MVKVKVDVLLGFHTISPCSVGLQPRLNSKLQLFPSTRTDQSRGSHEIFPPSVPGQVN